MRLAVELYDHIIGTLEGDARDFDFFPMPSGLDRFGANSPVLSVAVPLTPAPRRDRATRRRNWFSELLPEGDQYDHMLAQGGLRRGDTPSFLARYGRDVAGALQIWDLDDPTEPRTPDLRPVDDAAIRELLTDPLRSPLGNDTVTGRSSLGGVQPKIVLVRTEHGWAQSLGGHPTTHILKPRLGGALSTTIFDEEFGARIARRLGLSEVATTIDDFDGLPALVIERFDRHDGARVHQEDFNQALGAEGNQKYQEVGGVVSLQRVAETLQRHAPRSDLLRFARMVTLAVAIGNLDMHTKNIGLLHLPDGEVRLSPAYDVVPQTHQRNDGRLALAVNGTYIHSDVTRADLEAEFSRWGLSAKASAVDETLDAIADIVEHERPVEGAFPQLREQILGFIAALR